MTSSRITSGGAGGDEVERALPGVGGEHEVFGPQQLAQEREVLGIVVDDQDRCRIQGNARATGRRRLLRNGGGLTHRSHESLFPRGAARSLRAASLAQGKTHAIPHAPGAIPLEDPVLTSIQGILRVALRGSL